MGANVRGSLLDGLCQWALSQYSRQTPVHVPYRWVGLSFSFLSASFLDFFSLLATLSCTYMTLYIRTVLKLPLRMDLKLSRQFHFKAIGGGKCSFNAIGVAGFKAVQSQHGAPFNLCCLLVCTCTLVNSTWCTHTRTKKAGHFIMHRPVRWKAAIDCRHGS